MHVHPTVSQVNSGLQGLMPFGSTASCQYFECNKLHAPQCKVLPRLELGSLDSKSKVLTIAPQGPLSIPNWVCSPFKNNRDEIMKNNINY